MTATPSTRIDTDTLHTVHDHDTDEFYQVSLLHMVDGRIIGYRIDTEGDGGKRTFTPVEDGVVQALQP